MKKYIALIVLILCVAVPAFATDIITPNSITVIWTAPTLLMSGKPVPTGEVLKYNVFVCDASKDRTNPANLSKVADMVTPISATVTFASEGRYLIGVQCVRTVSGVLIPNQITWSDEAPPNSTNFIVLYAEATGKIMGFDHGAVMVRKAKKS